MTSTPWVKGMALGCALAMVATSASAAVIIRNATGKDANDFHIEFDAAADKLKLTSPTMGTGVVYPFPSPKQNQVDFAGGVVKNGDEFKINNLVVVKAGAGLRVLSWNFTLNGDPLTGEPLIKTSTGYTNLTGLALDGLMVRVVPEPAAWSLMILGFGVVGAMLRRRVLAAA